ncbi:lysoplasmalogenase [Bacillus sp. CGMCC 1.16607]|uniref:lysoplasmalogenase n=1 Tax=Bacillus sp. CGMCC 1.16607 TaxID=3351842 RepID=UPI003633ABE9
MIKKWLPLSILIMALLYIFVIPSEPIAIKLTFKIIPMLLILYFAFQIKITNNGKFPWIIITGLFFCMLGDGLLIWFVVGLTAFLIGHLFYFGGFLTRWSFSWPKFLSIIPIAIYSTTIGYQLLDSIYDKGEEALVIPVIFYVFVISIMYWSAIMTGSKLATAGSTLFVISDSVLAWDKFVSDIPYAGVIIMITYYSAQFLIAHTVSESSRKMRKNAKPAFQQ